MYLAELFVLSCVAASYLSEHAGRVDVGQDDEDGENCDYDGQKWVDGVLRIRQLPHGDGDLWFQHSVAVGHVRVGHQSNNGLPNHTLKMNKPLAQVETRGREKEQDGKGE